MPDQKMKQLSGLDYTEEDLMDEYSPECTPMKDYFRDKTVFLTGGTGFLGQLFVEKLLRSNVKLLYLLIREKKGKTPKERLQEMYSGVLFSRLRNIDPKYLERVKPIVGDIEKVQLDLKRVDYDDILDNVEIVIHAAADVRFDQILAKLIRINVRGTQELLKIAEHMKKLEVFSYISTAYSNCPRENIDERFYQPSIDPEIMIKFIEKVEKDTSFSIDVLQDRIILPWPNNYTFSKSLSEEVVRLYGQKIPICVIRPTIVISTHEDPIPAWCNNIYGLNGILVACGMGILRIMPFNKHMVGDIVCADFVINSTLAAIWTTYEDNKLSEMKSSGDPEVYHISSYLDRPLTWGEINNSMDKAFTEYPAKEMLWKQCPNTTTCPFMTKLLTIYYHVIPAYFFDFFLALTKKKLRLMPVYRKVQRFLVVLKHFMTTEWKFTNYNMRRVLERMSKEDQEFFPSDLKRLNWKEYCYEYNHGLKLYIARDPLNDVEVARKRYRKLCIAHYVVLFLYYSIHCCFFYYIFKYVGFFDSIRNVANEMHGFIQYSN